MTDMSPDWEEWRGWSDETGPDQGKSNSGSLEGDHDIEQTLSVSEVPLSESRVKDKSSSMTVNNESTGKGTVLSHGQKEEGGGGVDGIVEKTNPNVGKELSIGNASLSQQGIFQGGSKIGGSKGRLKEGGAAGFARENEEITFNVGKGINDDREGMEEENIQTSSLSQDGGEKGVALESHERNEKGDSNVGKSTYDYRKGEEVEARLQSQDGSELSKVHHGE